MPTATTNATEQITIALPKAVAQEVRAKVASGEFATESAEPLPGELYTDVFA